MATLNKTMFAADISRITEIKIYIDANLQSDLAIKQLAKRFGFSCSTLKRHFRSLYQIELHEYIVVLRMKLAVELLKDRSLSINEISETIGYKDRTSFTRAFTKHFGLSPKFYY